MYQVLLGNSEERNGQETLDNGLPLSLREQLPPTALSQVTSLNLSGGFTM